MSKSLSRYEHKKRNIGKIIVNPRHEEVEIVDWKIYFRAAVLGNNLFDWNLLLTNVIRSERGWCNQTQEKSAGIP